MSNSVRFPEQVPKLLGIWASGRATSKHGGYALVSVPCGSSFFQRKYHPMAIFLVLYRFKVMRNGTVDQSVVLVPLPCVLL